MTTLPQPYAQSYSFTAFQQSQGNDAFPGVRIDLEFQNLQAAIDGTLSFLTAAFRSDGYLANGSVTRDALAVGIQIGLNPPTVWAAGSSYEPGDAVTFGLGLYACQAEHVAGTDFPGDLAAGYWSAVANFATMGLLASGSVGSAQLAVGAVTPLALAAGAVGTPALADGGVTRAKLGADVGQIPIGGEMAFAGIRPPAGWLLEYGQAVSRTTYALLLAVLAETTTCTATNGSAVLASIPEDLTSLDLLGAALEGPGVPFGAFIGAVSSNSITMVTAAGNAATAVATTSGSTLTIFPYGNGDSATTFNVPDARGRGTIGRDTMGGTASGRLAGMAGSLAATGGAAQHTLTVPEMPSHGHTGTDTGHGHNVTDPGHPHQYGASNINNTTEGGGSGGPKNGGGTTGTTAPSKTNITVNTGAANIQIGSTGGGLPHSIMQPYRAANMIIFTGVLS